MRFVVTLQRNLKTIFLHLRTKPVICSFTERVKEIIDVLKDLNRGVYKRTMVSQKKEGEEADVGNE